MVHIGDKMALGLSINENPPKFSTKGDCHVYSWL